MWANLRSMPQMIMIIPVLSTSVFFLYIIKTITYYIESVDHDKEMIVNNFSIEMEQNNSDFAIHFFHSKFTLSVLFLMPLWLGGVFEKFG